MGQLEARLSVSVVIPARGGQDRLDLTLASLSEQSYPSHLVDVVVVDDASQPLLALPPIRPRCTRILRLTDVGVHGSGRARAEGARVAGGDVLLFLDADMIAEGRHVEAHLRWHHVLADAVVLGAKEFTDVGGIKASDVRDAVQNGSLGKLLTGRERTDHTWLDRLIMRTDGLVEAGDELFTAVVGATLSIPRALYAECGGFAAFDRRGIVDTEFGYRAVTAGATVVPEPEARSIHQGTRSFVTHGDEIKRLRAGIAANYLPTAIFRPPVGGRIWAVPRVKVLVQSVGSSYEHLLVTVDALLAADLDDLAVTIHGDLDSRTVQLLEDYYGSDPRVDLAEGGNVSTGFPSPYTVIVPVGAVLGVRVIRTLVDRLDRQRIGLIRMSTPAGELRLWRTAALHRARRHAATGDDSELIRTVAFLFGVAMVRPGSAAVTFAEPQTNRTGMVYDATLASVVEPARVRLPLVRQWVRRGMNILTRAANSFAPLARTCQRR